MDSPDIDAAILSDYGHVSGRYCYAGNCCAVVRAAGDRPRLRPGVVWRALYYHHTNRVHDAAIRVQPVPDEGDGAAGDSAKGYLCIDTAFCLHHGACACASDGVSTTVTLAAGNGLRQVTYIPCNGG